MPRVFVYGALMVHPFALKQGVAGRVDDHAVRFVLRGLPIIEPGFAALMPAPGSAAWGVFVDWEDAAWQRARSHEWGYVERPVRVHVADGERDAVALFHRRAGKEERPPSARYASMLLRGAMHHGFPDDVIERYRSLAREGSQWTLRLHTWLRR